MIFTISKSIVPSSVRSDTSAASPLSTSVAPLLRPQLESLFSFVRTNWPQITLKHDEFLPESEKIRTSLFGDDSTQWDARSIFKPRLLIKGTVIQIYEILVRVKENRRKPLYLGDIQKGFQRHVFLT